MEKNELQQMIREAVYEEYVSHLSHECWCCDWLRMHEKPMHMRFCDCLEKTVLDERGFCKWWILASDLNVRIKGDFTR